MQAKPFSGAEFFISRHLLQPGCGMRCVLAGIRSGGDGIPAGKGWVDRGWGAWHKGHMRFHPPATMSVEAALRDLGAERLEVRLKAAENLGRVAEHEAATTALVSTLADPAVELRYTAALALGELKAVEALEPLLTLLDDAEPLARQGAVVALGALGQADAGSALLARIDDPSADVRFQLPAALTQVATDDARAALLALLEDSDGEVRASAAAALGETCSPAAPSVLADALAAHLDDVIAVVSLEAAIALSRLEDARGGDALLGHLDSRDRAPLAAERLFQRPPAAAREALARQAGRLFAEPAVRIYLAGALARLDDERGRDRLDKALFGRNTIACGLAIELCAKIGDAWAQERLRALADHPRGRNWSEELHDALATFEPASQ